ACWESISTSEAGRLMRLKRSCARLFRWEISDSTDQTPKMNTANTRNGMMSVSPTIARSTTAASPFGSPWSVVRSPWSVAKDYGPRTTDYGLLLHLDTHDLLYHQSPEDLHDQPEDTHLDAQRLGPQNLNVVRLDV